MTAELLFASLHLAVPELILAVGALALLMIGVFNGDKATSTVTGLAVALLIAAGLWILIASPGQDRKSREMRKKRDREPVREMIRAGLTNDEIMQQQDTFTRQEVIDVRSKNKRKKLIVRSI